MCFNSKKRLFFFFSESHVEHPFFETRRGFTLMELMVYIALLGGIVLIAGRAFSDSAKMGVRIQSMLQTSQVAGNVGTIFKDDVAQIGAKSAKATDEDVFDLSHIHNVYMDPDNITEANKDSSSFIIVHEEGGSGLDRITMRRLRYNDAGAYDAVEEVSWYVDENKVLKRSCVSIEAQNEDENCPTTDTVVVSIAGNVDKFKLTPAKPTISIETPTSVNVLPSASETDNSFKLVPRFDEENIEAINTDPQNGGESIRLSGFYTNYDFDASEPISNPVLIKMNQVFLSPTSSDEASWDHQCSQVTLVPYVEYEISFSMPFTEDDPSRMFCPGRDHMAVGFRYAEDGKKPDQLNDFQFYPPTVGESRDIGLRKMRFTTNDTIKNVCLAFTFAIFSPVVSTGNINIANVKLKKIASSNYTFVEGYNPPITDKKNVKAIKLELSINKNGESGTETSIIAIPSNGPRD